MSEALTIVRDDVDMLEVWRVRMNELGLTYQTVDAIAGWADGWCSKIMCGMKKAGPETRALMNQALAIGLVPVLDPKQVLKIENRWSRRRRPHKAAVSLSIKLSIIGEEQVEAKLQRQRQCTEWGKMGGKRRAKRMKKRDRRRVATHAARTRWERVRAAEAAAAAAANAIAE